MKAICVAVCLSLIPAAVLAAEPAKPVTPAMRGDPNATDALKMLDGVWIGPAKMTGRDGVTTEFEQMERIGPMLWGEIRVMEGKARNADGTAPFQAFTVFSKDKEGRMVMRSYTSGHAGERVIDVKPDGFVWKTTGATQTEYTIVIKDNVWHETGAVVMPDGKRFPFFEMTLKRVADTTWPAGNPDFVTKN